jgi:DNA-binding response OmpR family regulator
MSEVRLDLTGCKILVTDDVPANLDVLVQTLDSEAYDVLVATHGLACLEVARQSLPDLILLDVMMPGIDGFETCRRLKADKAVAGIPVIFLSARDDVEGIVEGFDAGGVDYITKPFESREALARIRTHLERARLARDLAELNTNLEQKVHERTHELQVKVRELEGKDRIAEHLLTFNSLEETLAVVLEVMTSIVPLDQAAVYLKSDGAMKPAAAIGIASKTFDPEVSDPAWEKALLVVEQEMDPLHVDGDSLRAVIPITRDGMLLGVIEAGNHNTRRAITDADLRTLGSFALQAAVAIRDAQMRLDPDEWRDELDEVLELDDAVAAAEYLEEHGNS